MVAVWFAWHDPDKCTTIYRWFNCQTQHFCLFSQFHKIHFFRLFLFKILRISHFPTPNEQRNFGHTKLNEKGANTKHFVWVYSLLFSLTFTLVVESIGTRSKIHPHCLSTQVRWMSVLLFTLKKNINSLRIWARWSIVQVAGGTLSKNVLNHEHGGPHQWVLSSKPSG